MARMSKSHPPLHPLTSPPPLTLTPPEPADDLMDPTINWEPSDDSYPVDLPEGWSRKQMFLRLVGMQGGTVATTPVTLTTTTDSKFVVTAKGSATFPALTTTETITGMTLTDAQGRAVASQRVSGTASPGETINVVFEMPVMEL